MNTLAMTVGKLSFKTPLILASGYITETPAFYERSHHHGCAGMVTRSLKDIVTAERSRIPAPRYVVPNPSTMLNCEWGNENSWTQWRDEWLSRAKLIGGQIILSLSGRDPHMCARLIQAFEVFEPAAYEVNVSCSHSGVLHGNLNVDIQHVRNLLQVIRPLTNRPIWIKLSYSTLLLQMAKEAEECGADAIVCTNSIGPGLFLNPETGKPLLGTKEGVGGVTGNVIFPIALRCVYELYTHLTIPIVGVGGIYTGAEVCQMLMAGASAVQLYTRPALEGPRVFLKIRRELESYLQRHPELTNLSEIIGMAHQFNRENEFDSPAPHVYEERCTGCGICLQSCAFDAIRFERREGRRARVLVITENCIGCNACIGTCPPELNAIEARYGKT